MSSIWYLDHCAGCGEPYSSEDQVWWLNTLDDGTPLRYCATCTWSDPTTTQVMPPPEQTAV